MSLFKRMMTWGNSEANSALDHLEDPIKMADQGIRDLRKDLQESLEGFAKVKAQAIRSRRDVARQKEIATDYEQKAMLLLQKMQQGGLAAADGDRLASEALAKRDGAIQRATTIAQELQNYEKMKHLCLFAPVRKPHFKLFNDVLPFACSCQFLPQIIRLI